MRGNTKYGSAGLIGILITTLVIGIFMSFYLKNYFGTVSQNITGIDNDPTTSVIDEAKILKERIEARNRAILKE